MNRDSARKLSDSDFWQICHEMHPNTNYTFPVTPMLGVSNSDNFVSDLETLDERLGFEQHETSEDVSSDDSLQNLYMKKTRAHRKLLSTHSNCVNTKKILDTIDLFCNEEDDTECITDGKNSKSGIDEMSQNDTNHTQNELSLSHLESNEIDTINNTDDLLLKIADSVQQLKANVNQMGELNEKCQTGSDAFVDGDLIDFSDDWTNGESDNNSNTSDKPIKKVTHSCVQGSPNDVERLPYVKFEYRKNVLNNATGRAAVESNEIEYDAQMEVNNHRSGIQVNYCDEWHTKNGNDYPSPTTSESSNSSGNSSSSYSYTDSLSNSSRSTTSDNHIETETSNGHTCTNSNSHTLNTEHNRRYSEFEQCAHQTRPNIQTTEIHDSNDKSLTESFGRQSNVGAISRAKINIETNSEDDSSNGACAVHTFVTFTHTIRDINEVNSSIEPKSSIFGVEEASQDVLTTETASHIPASASNETKKLHIAASIVVSQPKPSATSSSFIKSLPLDTSTSADTFSLQKQAEWDADKNNNPLHYKDKRTKASPISTANSDENVRILHNQTLNSHSEHSENSSNIVELSASEKFVPILHELHVPNRIKVKQNLCLASAASTPFRSCDADNKDDEKHHGAYVKICLGKNPTKPNKCKRKYRKTVNGCLCSDKLQISVQKSAHDFHQQYNKRRGGGDLKCQRKKSTEYTKRQKSIDRRKNRIDKHQVHWCNYKWKCCRGHLCDYDLCETLLVTTKCGKTKSSPKSRTVNALTKHDKRVENGVQQKSEENFARKSDKIHRTGDRFADGTLCQSQHKRHSGSNNDGSICDSTANTTNIILPYSSLNKQFDAVETTSFASCDTDQSFRAINKVALCIDSSKECNRLITSNDGEQCTNDVASIVELKKTLELSPPIEKIKQVLAAVKRSATDLSAVNCDSNRCVENATNPTKCDDSPDRVTLNANSLKNSLKLSESCDSIFTLKRSASAASTSSLLSLNATEPFEASNRLRRLEERFKDLAITSLVGKKGRCVNNNLSQSTSKPTSKPTQHRIQLTLDGKGQSDISIKPQPDQSIETPTKSVIEESFTQPNSSHLSGGIITSGNERNLNYSDGNNNHIKFNTHTNEKISETQHICCSHTIQKRKQIGHLHSVDGNSSVDRRKSPIGIENSDENDSTAANRQLTTSDEAHESIDGRVKKVYHSSINEFDGSIPAHTYITNESLESSLKKDSTQSQQQKQQQQQQQQQTHHQNEIEDVKPNPNPNSKSSTNPLNNDHLPKIDTHVRNSIGSIDIKSIHFDDNKNSVAQILGNKNETKGINRQGSQSNAETATKLTKRKNERNEIEETDEDVKVSCKENTLNANETKESSTDTEVQQLDNIANRLINCTPVSISTESEEICNLFPENQRSTNDSPFIYRDEELNTNCVFDVRQFSDFHLPTFDQIYECYDELDDDVDDSEIPIYGLHVNQSKDILNNNDNNDAELISCDSEQFNYPSNYCHCTIESIVPLYPEAYRTSDPNKTAAIMRDMTNSGTLRGLLKKPNRPTPSQKNRVIFDETRNEFFDADYIILVRDDCPYDEEDEEPCTCGEHELVRLCCDEGCQCSAYTEDGRTPQSPKYAPPLEFVDQAALSPPEGYKDGGLQQALGGVLGSHIFGAQHMQQLQVIQRLQAKRAAMLAAQRSNNNGTNQSGSSKNHSIPPPPPLPAQTICTECAECSECAAKQEHDEALPHMALLSIQATSPERRFTQKEIIAGEERPKYLLIKQHQDSVSAGSNATAAAAATGPPTDKTDDAQKTTITAGNESRSTYLNSDISLKPTSISAQITGILKGGKLWKNETSQSDETTSSAASDDETSKRSVRFIDGTNSKSSDNSTEFDQDVCDGESIIGSEQNGSVSNATDTDTDTDTLKKHSMLFHNSLRPNSAVRQLFPTAVLNTNAPPAQTLTHEALRAFDESKRSQLKPSIVHSDSETDTIRRTIERNALRRSLIKYEPKKKAQKPDTSLEERIRMLTCDVDESPNEDSASTNDRKSLERRSSPTGEENPPPQPQVTKYVPDKSFSPVSTASSSSNSSISAYKKITDIFHKDKRHERIPEADENPIVIIPQQLQQDCRCPSAPDLGMGTHLPNANNQLQAVRPSDARRQFLNTLAPLTACVAGQRDDMSYYSLAAGDRNSTGSSRGSEYSIGDIDAILQNDDAKKVAPDVIAGTPGQEQNDELAAFAQQEATRTERIKKRYNNSETNAAPSVPTSNAGSDDDEQNDYGFNSRPSVRGIKPRSNEEMLEEMQTQLSSSSVTKAPPLLPRKGGQSNTLPKANTQSLQSKLMSTVQMQQPGQSQQQIASIVQQNISTWNAYYQEQAQRNSLPANTPAAYFQQLPIHAARHSFHQEESTIYQNCQGVAMEQHYGHTIAARSPTRRPESPPPLRNYHQTMVLIPYNTEYAQITADQIAAQHFQHQNILEYQQVTQQTIRVPIGYPLPGMQLHVVAGNANQPAYAQYATTTRQQTQMNATPRPTYGYIQENQVPAAVKYTERGVPEGAASIQQSDCNTLMQQPVTNNVQGNVPVTSTANNTQTSNTSTTAQQGAVFYAMNV